MNISDEILLEIPKKDILILKNLYEDYKTKIPHVYSVINSCLFWNRHENTFCFNCFYVKGDNWSKSGAFVFIWEYTSCYLFAYTLEKGDETLRRGLSKTKRIKWNLKINWLVSDNHIDTIMKVVQDLQLDYNRSDISMWMLRKEKASQYQIQIPDDVYIKKLNQNHVNLINNFWPHKYEGSDNYVSVLISQNDSYGIFLKSDDSLVSWVLRNHFGLLCNFQTLPGHRKKGYGSLLVKIMAKELAERVDDFIGCIIIKGNAVSEELFQKLGFYKHQDCIFLSNMS